MKNAITKADPEAQKVAQSVRPLVAIHCELCDEVFYGSSESGAILLTEKNWDVLITTRHRCI